MIRRNALTILVFLGALFMTGCMGSISQKLNQIQDRPPMTIELPQRQVVSSDQLPADLRLALTALIEGMRGRGEKVPNAGFSRDGLHVIRQAGFSYDGFNVFHVDIVTFEREAEADSVSFVYVEGVLHFADTIGRRMGMGFSAGYSSGNGKVEILFSQAELLPNPFPEIRTFFIPRTAAQRWPVQARDNFTQLYQLAARDAVNMQPTNEERSRRNEYEKMSTWQKLKQSTIQSQEEYLILAFCMDRLTSDAKLLMSITNNQYRVAPSATTPMVLEDNGWQVAAAGGKMLIDSPTAAFFVHVQYQPDGDNAAALPITIGRFSSQKNYSSSQSAEKNMAQASGANMGGPLATGRILLNPGVKSDAMQIQSRLSALGFYSSTVDGIFGRGSRASLKKFRQATGLGDDATWDMATQRRLFEGTLQ